MSAEETELAWLVSAIAASSKYRDVSPDLVRAIGRRELSKGGSRKTVIKATKNKLHQTVAAYQAQRIDYDQALQMLQEAQTAAAWRSAAREIMAGHVSTRERLPILDHFYDDILAGLPAPRRVLDLACGLNPLALPWMSLPADSTYIAYDVAADMMGFLDAALQTINVDGRAEVRDVLYDPPAETADLALLLKALPCLEQLQKGAASRLLDAIQARYLLISYPVASLGGRQKGMTTSYDAQFQALIAGRGWKARRHLFSSELAFLVDTMGERGNDVVPG